MNTPSNKIILLHGAIGAADQLEPLKVLLQEEGKEVYSFSFSGHGKIPFQTNFGIEQFASELKEYILSNALQGATIFGYSMGGFVALQLASENPELIGRIITLGTKFNWTPETAVKEAKMLDPEAIQSKVPKFADAIIKRHGEENWKLLLDKTATMMKDLAKKQLLQKDQLEKINIPVLVGLADKDTMVTYEETRTVFDCLPNAAMYMLPQSKHPIEQVNLEMLAQFIIDFINCK